MRRLVVGLVLLAALVGQGLSPSPTPALDCSSPTPGQVVACAGRFWQDGQPILLHGLDTSGIGQGDDMTDEDYAAIASWHMNAIRMKVGWAQFEPDPPTDNGNGTWTHHYRTRLLTQLYDQIAMARAHGITVLLSDRCFCEGGWPEWLGETAYNSHGKEYDFDLRSGRQAYWTDYWSDDLAKQLTMDWATSLAGWMAGQDGVIGYEPLDEPNSGNLPQIHDTTQMIMDWQLEVAKAVRAVDPNRIIVFTTRESSGVGIVQADLSGWAALGNVAFDVHDFFGGRWGGGHNLADDPGSPTYGERTQDLFDFTLTPTVPPYLGTTEGQARFIDAFTSRLAPWGIPLFVGEFTGNSEGDPPDPDILTLFGTMTQGFNLEGVAWTALSYDGFHSVRNPDGTLRPWVTILCNAAAYPDVVQDCPVVP